MLSIPSCLAQNALTAKPQPKLTAILQAKAFRLCFQTSTSTKQAAKTRLSST
jgi:hypothetical protein